MHEIDVDNLTEDTGLCCGLSLGRSTDRRNRSNTLNRSNPKPIEPIGSRSLHIRTTQA